MVTTLPFWVFGVYSKPSSFMQAATSFSTSTCCSSYLAWSISPQSADVKALSGLSSYVRSPPPPPSPAPEQPLSAMVAATARPTKDKEVPVRTVTPNSCVAGRRCCRNGPQPVIPRPSLADAGRAERDDGLGEQLAVGLRGGVDLVVSGVCVVVCVVLVDLARLHIRVLVTGVGRGGGQPGDRGVALARLPQQVVDVRGVLRDRVEQELERRREPRGEVLATSLRNMPVAALRAAAVSARSSSLPYTV